MQIVDPNVPWLFLDVAFRVLSEMEPWRLGANLTARLPPHWRYGSTVAGQHYQALTFRITGPLIRVEVEQVAALLVELGLALEAWPEPAIDLDAESPYRRPPS